MSYQLSAFFPVPRLSLNGITQRVLSLKERSSTDQAAPLLNSLASCSRKFPMRMPTMNPDGCFYSFSVRFLLERIRKDELDRSEWDQL
jgi:hypothetical protein